MHNFFTTNSSSFGIFKEWGQVSHFFLRRLCRACGYLAVVLVFVSALSLDAVTLADYPFSFSPDPARYAADVANLIEKDESNPPPTGAIVAIGSSSMRMWHSRIHQDLAGVTVIPHGFGGSVFSDAIYYAQSLVLDYAPRSVLVYEGDNDTAQGNSANRVRDDLAFFVDLCRTTLPDLRVYVISVKPSVSRQSIWESQVVPANALLKDYCEQTTDVTYIDVASPMLNADGSIRTDIFRPDNLHLNALGYDLWGDAIAPIVLEGELAHESTAICEECETLESGDALRIDFGAFDMTTDTPDEDGLIWNNVTSIGVDGVLMGIMTTTSGKKVKLGIEIVEAFAGVNSSGVTTSPLFPSTAGGDSIWAGSFDGHEAAVAAKGIVRFSGLSDKMTFRLSLYPSRVGADGTLDRLTRYTVADRHVDVEASDNVSTVATFEDLVPASDGTLSIEVSVSPEGNGRFAYLNALALEVSGDGAKWRGYTLVENVFVDTGDWLGWLYVDDAPWVYCYLLSGWVFLSKDSVDANGTWIFSLFRNA